MSGSILYWYYPKMLWFRASLKKNFRFAGAAWAVALRCKLGQYEKYSRFACALRASPRRSHRITEILFEKRSMMIIAAS